MSYTEDPEQPDTQGEMHVCGNSWHGIFGVN